MTKVLSNLFTNAIKYGKSYVNITLTETTDHKCFEIRVSNDGNTIPVSLKEKVFEAFFQIKEDKSKAGSGLGLALAKSLVELHDGKIFVDDRTENTTFVVRIPIVVQSESQDSDTQIAEIADEQGVDGKDVDVNDTSSPAIDPEKESILVAEDNKELLSFLKENLSKKWNVYAVDNGGDAQRILDSEKISVVVSDVVMPVCDGMELLHRLATGTSTSHIPVILLTAKTDEKTKIEALREGVAAYIEKPFSMVQLEEQIENLIERHNKLKQNLNRNSIIDSATIAKNKNEERFLNKVTDIIVANIEKENFNVDELADEICMSRTSLHRKLKSVSGMTPGDFIRMVRLKKAAELLVNGEYRVNEICLLVGFHSSSYFTKSFYKQYGVLPKDYVKSLSKEES